MTVKEKISSLKNRVQAADTEKLAFLISTFFKTGLAPKAPGTVGSLATLPLAWLLICFFGLKGLLFGILLVYIIGERSVKKTMEKTEHDPGFIVIDEVAGQLISFIFVAEKLHTTFNPWLYLIGFIFFRLFDITKVWPANYFDGKMEDSAGVMLDDCVSGFYAAVCVGLSSLLLSGFFPSLFY